MQSPIDQNSQYCSWRYGISLTDLVDSNFSYSFFNDRFSSTLSAEFRARAVAVPELIFPRDIIGLSNYFNRHDVVSFIYHLCDDFKYCCTTFTISIINQSTKTVNKPTRMHAKYSLMRRRILTYSALKRTRTNG
jgi:hypothetical protein